MYPPGWLTRHTLLGGLVLVIAAGCATAPVPPLSQPKTLQPADLASLAGEWRGSITGSLGTPGFGRGFNTLQVTVNPDGTFRSSINNIPGQGAIRIVDGKIVYEGSGNRGTAALHERAGRQVIRGDGTLVGANGWSTFEVARP